MRRIFLFLLLLFILIVLACPNYNSGEVGYGNLSLKINFPEANSRFATITPELDVQQYVIDFVEYNGESVQKDSVAVTDGACSISLAAGIWDLYIYAVSTAGYKIAELEVEDISIKISGVNNFAIDLIPVAGTGTVSVSLDVSEKPGEISIESVEYSLLKGRSSPVEVDSGVLASPYLISYTGDSGTDYILKININTDSGVVFLEGAVHVYAGNTTIGILTVSSSDFYKSSTPIIADHTVVELYDDIPTEWIAEVKKMLLIMGGESHGRAYNYGLNLLEVQDPTYAVSTQWSAGELEAGTDQHLRASRSYRFGETWKDTMGEADCFTNSDAISNMKTGLSYVAANYSGKIVQGFGWCWDMTWGNAPTSLKDPLYGCGWAGASKGTPEDPSSTYGLPWGLDSDDYDITENSVSMQTYLDAVAQYNAYGPAIIFLYTTGPVDGYPGENGYQRYLKHEYIRDYVNENNEILFDYADILCWDYDANEYTTTEWNGNVFQDGNPILATGGAGYDAGEGGCHISEEGCLQIAKAMWWMLARIAGWDGT